MFDLDREWRVTCAVRSGGLARTRTQLTGNEGGIGDWADMENTSITAVTTLAVSTTVDLACSTLDDGLQVIDSSLAAIKVTNLH